MIGPFKKAQGGYTHVLVAINKFTKWIEYKPIASLTSAKAVEFIQDIIFRFVIPNTTVSVGTKSEESPANTSNIALIEREMCPWVISKYFGD
jgi:hypothetical protein